MANYSFLHFLCMSSILTSTLLFVCSANDEKEKLHIVYMGSLPNDEAYSPTSHHLTMLQQVIEDNGDASKHLIRSYKRSFNGFAAMITDTQRDKLANMEGVVSVFESKTLELHTTRSWDFMGLKDQSTKRNLIGESDVIIGVIDTGVWPESDSFKDEGFGPIPKKWKGVCAGGHNFTCNKKLIGARYYMLGSIGKENVSARDTAGHGTHTASTAAGNRVANASFYGFAEGIARGGVPSARIAAYSVCPANFCYMDMNTMSAFDDAIADGVDLISISAGHSSVFNFTEDVIAIGAFHAMEKGILTVQSAGNSGPTKGLTISVSPWILSVAGSTIDRRIIDKVTLGNGVNVSGRSVNTFTSNGKKNPLVIGKFASTKNCSSGLANCSCLDPELVKGKVVCCDNYDGYDNAFHAGAFGSIFRDKIAEARVMYYPASFFDPKTYDFILSYANSTINPQVEILKSEEFINTDAPTVADLSSRGPNKLVKEIMKPDISAPAVEILASYSPIVSPSGNLNDKRSVKYNIMSGTSMSCPHVTGIAGYVKSFYPHWSPAAIKSAIMTTAKEMKGSEVLKEFAYGSGHVDPLRAINPGLIFDLSKADYVSFLCNIGYSTKKVEQITRDNSSCPSSAPQRSLVKNINYPSFATQVQPMKSFEINFTRIVTNVGLANSTYKVSVMNSAGLNISVVPQVLSFKSLEEKQSFQVNVVGEKFEEIVLSSSLVWLDGTHSVRFPIVIDVSQN